MSLTNGASRTGSGISTDDRCVVFESNMESAKRNHYRRTKDALPDPNAAMPFDRLLTFEEEAAKFVADQGEEPVGEYELRLMAQGYRLAFNRIFDAGIDPLKAMKRAFALGRQIRHPVPSSLTMTESGLMFSETKAAHSFRCKVLSGELKLAGAKGIRLPGQKSPLASESYAESARGNSNRAKPKKAVVRQGSFLKQLQTAKTRVVKRAPKQTSNVQRPTPNAEVRTTRSVAGSVSRSVIANRPAACAPQISGSTSTLPRAASL